MARKMYPVDELELEETIRKDPDGLNFRLKHITEQQKFLDLKYRDIKGAKENILQV